MLATAEIYDRVVVNIDHKLSSDTGYEHMYDGHERDFTCFSVCRKSLGSHSFRFRRTLSSFS